MYRVATREDQVGNAAGPRWTNRLVHEASPYLRQHAHNPVDWYPWGEAAFQRARDEDKPILLSIGYAACHWCHVMEHESFEDPDAAALLNEGFVAIKVDREERPDVDAIYIEALSALAGHAGWPANLFLLPDLRPFAGGTYMPPAPRYGLPSFVEVLGRVRQFWTQRRGEIDGLGDRLVEAIGRGFPRADVPLGRDGYTRAVADRVAREDTAHGGLAGGQKFPQTPTVELLLLGAHDGLPGAREALASSVGAFVKGGLYDPLGGGFHRYCVDAAWTVPHFEKMLYDNAQLLRVLARASSVLAPSDPALAARCVRAVRETVSYLFNDLSDPSGLFVSSEDADDPGGEGYFYTFTAAEACAALGDTALPYGIAEAGNFEHGRTVLSTWAGRPSERTRQALRRARDARARPPVDDKRVVAWNGLAIGALAEAGRLLGFDAWVARAARAADVLLAAIAADGEVRRLPGGAAPGTLEDHAFLADGLLDLFQARPSELRWLAAARDLAARALDMLADPAGGLFQAAARPDLIVRRKDFQDGAEPSGNGRMADVLRRLAAYGAPLEGPLDALLDAASGLMTRAPVATPELWRVVRALAAEPTDPSGPLELVIVGPPDHPEALTMQRAWDRRWRPQGVLAMVRPGDPVAATWPLFAERPAAPDGAPLAYLCRRGVCLAPVATADALEALL